MTINIGWLYPDLMSTYGDRGNIIALSYRLKKRGIKSIVHKISVHEPKELISEMDIIFMGGAQDKQQEIVNADLKNNKEKYLIIAIENNVSCLFVCGAYQFLGKYYKAADGTIIDGLGAFDLYTENPGINFPRCIGNIIIESKLFTELMEILGIRKTRTTALHPQSDGQVERQHQTITNYLAKYISSNQKDWDRWVPMFLLSYRTSKHEATGLSPAEVYLGRDLRLPLDLLRGRPPDSQKNEFFSYEHFNRNLQLKLERIHSEARKRMVEQSSRAKARYDCKARRALFQEGQKVWLFNPRREKGKAPKLQSNWEGPYVVVKKLSEVVFCIQKFPKH